MRTTDTGQNILISLSHLRRCFSPEWSVTLQRAAFAWTWATRQLRPTRQGLALRLLEPDDARPVVHSEEHLVIETAQAENIPLGTPLLAIPTHICPTVALHRRAYVIEEGEVAGQWEVTARDRVLGV